MYEMYPDAWPTAVDQPPADRLGRQARRRARKEHSVVPPVLAVGAGPQIAGPTAEPPLVP